MSNKRKINQLIFHINEKCILSCKGCYYKKNNAIINTYGLEVLIDILENYNVNELNILINKLYRKELEETVIEISNIIDNYNDKYKKITFLLRYEDFKIFNDLCKQYFIDLKKYKITLSLSTNDFIINELQFKDDYSNYNIDFNILINNEVNVGALVSSITTLYNSFENINNLDNINLLMVKSKKNTKKSEEYKLYENIFKSVILKIDKQIIKKIRYDHCLSGCKVDNGVISINKYGLISVCPVIANNMPYKKK